MKTIDPIKKRRLGKSDLWVSPIGLGGNKFSDGSGLYGKFIPAIPKHEANGIVKAALDGGINWFDTAEMYGFGSSERAIAGGLRAANVEDDKVILVTKWSPIMRTAGNISTSINNRLKNLGGYTIDLYLVHNPYGFSSVEAEMEAMADLVEAGKIGSVGVSNFNGDQMRRAHQTLSKRGLPLVANQVQYSLIHRQIEGNGLLDAARELGVTIIAWAPLGSGVLTGKFHDPADYKKAPFFRRMMVRRFIEPSRPVVSALEEIAAKYGVTPGQVALSWLVRSQGDLVVAIPGASKTRHAQESAAAQYLTLSEEEMVQLDELTRRFRES